MRRMAIVLVMLAATLPAYSQGTDLKELLSGNTYSLTVKLKDLNGEWRRVTVGGQGDLGGFMQMILAMVSGAGGSGAYYTKGETVTLGGETYIIAYRPQGKPLDFSALARPGAEPPKPEKLKPDTTLSLSLLNLRTSGSLNDIRPFDLKQEIAESETATGEAESASSLNNLKQLGLALNMYVQDYDEVLPPMKDAATVKKLLYPYVKNDAVFVNPETKEPYQPNPILSRKKLAHITAPAEMVAFYEASPAADGTRGVAFVDGHSKRIRESEWPRVKKASKIP